MTVDHHPEEDVLVAYAAGQSSEGVSLIVATHLAYCPACRTTLAALESAGGLMLAELQPAALSSDALNNVLASLNGVSQEKRKPARRAMLPAPLAEYVGENLDQLAWRRIAPGIAYHPLFGGGGVRAQLIRVAAGHGVAEHSHRGAEMSLVIQGGYSDETGQYGVGDFQTASPDTLHAPTADADGTCIILAVTQAPLVFNGLLPRLIGRLAGF